MKSTASSVVTSAGRRSNKPTPPQLQYTINERDSAYGQRNQAMAELQGYKIKAFYGFRNVVFFKKCEKYPDRIYVYNSFAIK